jgi:hypothetical protein
VSKIEVYDLYNLFKRKIIIHLIMAIRRHGYHGNGVASGPVGLGFAARQRATGAARREKEPVPGPEMRGTTIPGATIQ